MGQEHGLQGGEDPFNREAIWLSGYDETSVCPFFLSLAPCVSFNILTSLQSLYRTFHALNLARQKAIASHPLFLSTLVRPYQPNNHTVALSKPPLLSLLSSFGSAPQVVPIHLTQAQTAYKPLIAIIDVLSAQILLTDPNGGLTVPIVHGQPRVFLPLGVWEGRGDAAASLAPGWRVDTAESGRVPSSVTGSGSGSWAGHRKKPSLTAVMNWFNLGHGGSGGTKHREL
jgi:alpha-amylase